MKKIQIKKLKISKSWLVVGAIVLIIGGLIYRNVVTPPATLTSQKVEKKTIVSEVSANGVVDASKKADLKFNLPGKLVWLPVKEGDTVRAYQAVASLDQRLLQKDLENSLSLYMTTRWDFDTSTQDTYDGKVLTDVIRREMDKSQFALDRSVAAVEIKDIVKREAVLTTPIAGTVISTNDLTPGINLSGADLEKKTIRVADLKTVFFNAKVDEVDYGKVTIGQEATVTLDAFPGKVCAGKVRKIGKQGVESTGGVVTIPVEITLDNCEHEMAIGLNGEARLVLSRTENTLVIPKKYIFTKEGSSYVYVQTGKTWREREERNVSLGATSLTETEITSGLAENETVLFIPAQ